MSDERLRQQMADLLSWTNAHPGAEEALGGLPPELRGIRPAAGAHTPWQLLEHLRLAQWDILEFSRNPDHVSPRWPEGYWPRSAAPPDEGAWERSVESFRDDLRAMIDQVADPARDLLAPLAHAGEASLMREALLLADHNAYHLGQLVLVRKLLGAWPPPDAG